MNNKIQLPPGNPRWRIRDFGTIKIYKVSSVGEQPGTQNGDIDLPGELSFRIDTCNPGPGERNYFVSKANDAQISYLFVNISGYKILQIRTYEKWVIRTHE